MTRNLSGPGNMLSSAAAIPKGADFTADLIDGFIKDGWIAPESRDRELASHYRADARNLRAELDARYNQQAAREYAAEWVARWLGVDE